MNTFIFDNNSMDCSGGCDCYIFFRSKLNDNSAYRDPSHCHAHGHGMSIAMGMGMAMAMAMAMAIGMAIGIAAIGIAIAIGIDIAIAIAIALVCFDTIMTFMSMTANSHP